MVAGVVSYEEEEGIKVLVRNDAINRLNKTFEGRPVVVQHQDIDTNNLKDQMDGVVVKSFYNAPDGWHWTEILAITDECQEAIQKGWKVSNMYLVKQFGEGGSYLNVNYDREVLDGEFDHLAIVENPRYEDAIIMTPEEFHAYNIEAEFKNNKLKNNKTKPKGNFMKFKFFSKTEVEKEMDAEKTMVTLANGKDVSVQDMVNAIEDKEKAEKEAKEKEEKEKENAVIDKDKAGRDAIVTVNGKDMKVSELAKSYENMCKEKEAKENALSEEEEEEKKKKENEAKEEKEKEEKLANEKKKKEQDEFTRLKNSMNNVDDSSTPIETMAVKEKRGKERY